MIAGPYFSMHEGTVSVYVSSMYRGMLECGRKTEVLTVVAEAVQTGAGGALVDVELATGAGEAPGAAAAEAQREARRVGLLHALGPVLARVVGFARQELAVHTWVEDSGVESGMGGCRRLEKESKQDCSPVKLTKSCAHLRLLA